MIERPLADGRAEVMVVLHTNNALTWVAPNADFASLDEDLLFGHTVGAVMSGATPGLCKSLLKVTFINSSPGADLPDLLELIAFAGQDVLSVSMRCNAAGPLREDFGVADGTPGKAITVQVGLFATGSSGAVADGFPVEFIKLQVEDD